MFKSPETHFLFISINKFVSLEQFDQINLNFASQNKCKNFSNGYFYSFFIKIHIRAIYCHSRNKALKFLYKLEEINTVPYLIKFNLKRTRFRC